MKNKHSFTPRCYETHKPLPLGDGIVIYGGSCGTPLIQDADVYVGLDYSMDPTTQKFPWEGGASVFFPIPDMGVPSNPSRFSGMIEWLSVQLIAGKKVHVGCIGGHGRTGMVLAALAATMLKRTDAIKYVRENYCHKAVETEKQVQFLVKHFGVESVEPTKQKSYFESKADLFSKPKAVVDDYEGGDLGGFYAPPKAIRKHGGFGSDLCITPAKGPYSVWGGNVKFSV